MTATYSIRTWDMELQEFTPQTGVPSSGLTIGDLKRSMRMLREIGYSCNRCGGDSDPSVLIEREDTCSP
jgi:hypothetical protein